MRGLRWRVYVHRRLMLVGCSRVTPRKTQNFRNKYIWCWVRVVICLRQHHSGLMRRARCSQSQRRSPQISAARMLMQHAVGRCTFAQVQLFALRICNGMMAEGACPRSGGCSGPRTRHPRAACSTCSAPHQQAAQIHFQPPRRQKNCRLICIRAGFWAGSWKQTAAMVEWELNNLRFRKLIMLTKFISQLILAKIQYYIWITIIFQTKIPLFLHHQILKAINTQKFKKIHNFGIVWQNIIQSNRTSYKINTVGVRVHKLMSGCVKKLLIFCCFLNSLFKESHKNVCEVKIIQYTSPCLCQSYILMG